MHAFDINIISHMHALFNFFFLPSSLLNVVVTHNFTEAILALSDHSAGFYNINIWPDKTQWSDIKNVPPIFKSLSQIVMKVLLILLRIRIVFVSYLGDI